MLSRHFSVGATTMKEIIVRDLGLEHAFDDGHLIHCPTLKVTRIEASNELLQILDDLEADSFDEIITGDGSGFHSLYEPLGMFSKLPRDVITRTRKEIDVKKRIFTIFFTNKKLLTTEHLPKGQKYDQDYIVSDILSELEREK
jgi:hypothetical protein